MNIGEIFVAVGIVICGIFATRTMNNYPHRIDMCLVGSGPEAEDVTTNVWSDQVETWKEKYPGSYCGRCGGKVMECP